MKNIEFLPARYREQDRRRQGQTVRFTICCGLAALVACAHLAQTAFWRAEQRLLAELAAPLAQAQQLQAELAARRGQLDTANAAARLYAWLEHPWPRSRVLAELSATAPAEITVTEVWIGRQIPAAVASRAPVAASGDAVGAAPPVVGAAADFHKLQEKLAGAATVVEISGLTGDSAAVGRWADRLNALDLTSQVELKSLVAAASGDPQRRLKFILRLTLLPGYGQPGGPPSHQLATLVPTTARGEP